VLNEPSPSLSLSKGEATNVPFELSVQITMYLGLQKIPASGILMIPLPEI
jgi:hypothetical protein